VIPYGLDEKIFRPVERQAARARFELPPDAVCFLFGADNTAEKRKGFGVLTNALRETLQNSAFREAVSSGRVRFLSFGAPRSAVPPEFPAPITALGRIDSEEQLAALYSVADVFLLPSLEDNLPNVLLESMACGTPVIAHNVGGIPDVVQDGVNGLLTPPDEPGRFAAAIVRLWSDPPSRLKLGAQAQDIRQTHTLTSQGTAYLSLYRSLEASSSRTDKPSGVCRFLEPGQHIGALLPKLLATAKSRHRWAPFRKIFTK
jgi:glycosyltransferase involved in cell wall biosynthesis